MLPIGSKTSSGFLLSGCFALLTVVGACTQANSDTAADPNIGKADLVAVLYSCEAQVNCAFTGKSTFPFASCADDPGTLTSDARSAAQAFCQAQSGGDTALYVTTPTCKVIGSQCATSSVTDLGGPVDFGHSWDGGGPVDFGHSWDGGGPVDFGHSWDGATGG